MTILGPSTDYTDKDFDALVERAHNLITSAYPDWSDLEIANFGNLMVELFSFTTDVVTKYQDNQAAEAFWGRVTQRRNILSLAKQIGFTPRGNTASVVELSISVTPAPTGTLTIPARSRARTETIVSPVYFETVADLVFDPGVLGPLLVQAENAESKSEIFTSSNKPNQEIKIGGTPYLDNTLSVVAGNGTFTQVDNFLASTSLDFHFTVVVDSDDRATVRFGNGINGVIPTGSMTASYKIGGGATGYVEPNTVRRIEGVYVDSLGNAITVSVTNLTASTRALDRQSVEEIRVAGPESLRVLTRTVSREDYEINARKVDGVARALMLTSDQDGGIGENFGMLFIVPIGGGAPSAGVKAAVLEMVTTTYPRTLTFGLDVVDAVYLSVNIDALVWFTNGATPASKVSTRAAIVARLQAAFAIVQADDAETNLGIDFGYNLRDENGDPAGSIAWSDIMNLIRDTPGVRKIDAGSDGLLLNGVRADLPIAVREFPTLGTVIIRDGLTGLPVG